MKQLLMQESGWPNSTRNIMKDICQKSDVRDVITIQRLQGLENNSFCVFAALLHNL